jgi:hypothetical protein
MHDSLVMQSFAQFRKHPQIIRDRFMINNYNNAGIVAFKLRMMGVEKIIPIDNFIFKR